MYRANPNIGICILKISVTRPVFHRTVNLVTDFLMTTPFKPGNTSPVSSARAITGWFTLASRIFLRMMLYRIINFFASNLLRVTMRARHPVIKIRFFGNRVAIIHILPTCSTSLTIEFVMFILHFSRWGERLIAQTLPSSAINFHDLYKFIITRVSMYCQVCWFTPQIRAWQVKRTNDIIKVRTIPSTRCGQALQGRLGAHSAPHGKIWNKWKQNKLIVLNARASRTFWMHRTQRLRMVRRFAKANARVAVARFFGLWKDRNKPR